VERREWLAGAASLAAPLFAAQAPLFEPRGDESIYPLLHGLYWLSANVARDQPLALLVDDVHWADGPSLAFFGFLVPSPRGTADTARGCGTAGGGAHARVAGGDPRRSFGPHRKPAALSADGVHRLLSLHLTDPVDSTFACACRDATAGNPFLLHELLRELERR
jgi:hypothetical protein